MCVRVAKMGKSSYLSSCGALVESEILRDAYLRLLLDEPFNPLPECVCVCVVCACARVARAVQMTTGAGVGRLLIFWSRRLLFRSARPTYWLAVCDFGSPGWCLCSGLDVLS